ncbi:MAG: M28 family metallopeptidase [Acidobacteriota bacterium]
MVKKRRYLDLDSISGETCLRTVRDLCGLGVRFAGSGAEQKAAIWIEDRFKEMGLTSVQRQEFPCLTFESSRCRLSVWSGKSWRTVAAEPAAHSRPTPKGGLQSDLMVVEQIPPTARACRKLMRGRAVLLYCSHLFRIDVFKRVMAASPAALLLVDDRFPNDWTVAIGFPRYWVDLISCPVVNVAYTTAWEMVRGKRSRIRLEMVCRAGPATSQNVIAESAGSLSPEEIIVISAHHDSVLNNPGADDNCSGVAAVLELARLFSTVQSRRTLRFLSYGAEEQLSEGAKYYALHAPDLDQIQFVLNIDAVGAWMGHTGIYYVGPTGLRKTLRQVNRQAHFPGRLIAELSPFSDHFPLTLSGIPSVWYYRTTFLAARHYHHSRLETPDVISPQVLERTIAQQALLLQRVANEKPMPFPRELPRKWMNSLSKMGRDWYGLDRLSEL